MVGACPGQYGHGDCAALLPAERPAAFLARFGSSLAGSLWNAGWKRAPVVSQPIRVAALAVKLPFLASGTAGDCLAGCGDRLFPNGAILGEPRLDRPRAARLNDSANGTATTADLAKLR